MYDNHYFVNKQKIYVHSCTSEMDRRALLIANDRCKIDIVKWPAGVKGY